MIDCSLTFLSCPVSFIRLEYSRYSFNKTRHWTGNSRIRHSMDEGLNIGEIERGGEIKVRLAVERRGFRGECDRRR